MDNKNTNASAQEAPPNGGTNSVNTNSQSEDSAASTNTNTGDDGNQQTGNANNNDQSAAPPLIDANSDLGTFRTPVDIYFRNLTWNFLNQIDWTNPPTPDKIVGKLLYEMEVYVSGVNAGRGDHEPKVRIPTELFPVQIADILLCSERIVIIDFSEGGGNRKDGLLSIYDHWGKDYGLYVSDEAIFHQIIKWYSYNITKSKIEEVMQELRDRAPVVSPCSNPDLIAVNNGIFNYKTKQLLPFHPAVVFTAKSRVNYNPNATNQVIYNKQDGTAWDVESWMAELSDDPKIVKLLWQILGAIIRPNVRWDKSAWFYSEKGNNGKGTLCELMRQLCGDGSYAVLPVSEMGKEFRLESLIGCIAIIVDENDVGAYLDKAANLKAIITHDVISINRKYRSPIKFRFPGLMVQCINGLPKIKDKSNSLYRRQIIVPFTKCFTGRERKYIKDEYLHMSAVLEYVLWRILNMEDYYEFKEPESCRLTLEEYKEFNDPLRQFAHELFPQFVWDVVPSTFLFDLYKAWMKANVPSGSLLGRNTFIKELALLMEDSDEWEYIGKTSVRIGNMMDAVEPLIGKYGLESWKEYSYSTSQRSAGLPTHTRGYLRKQPRNSGNSAGRVDSSQNIL